MIVLTKYGFDLQRRNDNGKKKKITFIIAFVCFAIVLGAVSFLLLWRSLNYDFNNFFKKSDEISTTIVTTEKTDTKTFEGESLFLTAVTSDDSKKTLFINLINVDLSDKTVKIIPVDSELTDSKSGLNCSEILTKNGVKELVTFLNSHYGKNIDRYAVLTETGYKSVFRALGNITVKVSSDIEYDTEDMFLELKKGENILTPEKTYKYMKYISETTKGKECATLNAEVISSAFTAFYTSEKIVSGDSLFSKLINYCTTDITIVDYTQAKEKIEYLAPKSSKEKLKVYVSSKEFTNEEK